MMLTRRTRVTVPPAVVLSRLSAALSRSFEVHRDIDDLAFDPISKAFTGVRDQRGHLEHGILVSFNDTSSLSYPFPAEGADHRSGTIWTVSGGARGILHRGKLLLTARLKNGHATAHGEAIKDEGLKLDAVVTLRLDRVPILPCKRNLLVCQVEHCGHLGDDDVCQEVHCKEVVANISRAEDQATVGVPLVLSGLVQLAIFDDARTTAALRHYADLLLWAGLPNALVAAVGVPRQAVPDEPGIRRPAKGVVDREDVEASDACSLQASHAATLLQGWVKSTIPIGCRRHHTCGLQDNLAVWSETRKSALLEEPNIVLRHAKVRMLVEELNRRVVIDWACHDEEGQASILAALLLRQGDKPPTLFNEELEKWLS
mmetsp:Transcript_47476/g.85446  ORF Transcript_47476/g.85446 Transcript_47476/m.85446 type:complete len:372 (+) Transcript_47476:151-1266(+)